MSNVRLYLRLVGVALRGQMQYRASFWLLLVSQALATGIDFVALLALMNRFGQLRGWSLPEVGLLYGLVHVSMAIAIGIGAGFDSFDLLIKRGDFDRLLLRPRGLVLQVLGGAFELRRLGRLLQGGAVLVWSASRLQLDWTPAHFGLIALAIAGGAALFGGLFVLQASLAFWTTETLELFNILTFGGVETATYPLSIYRPWFRAIFLWLVPLGCVTWFPGLALLGREANPLLWLAPLAGFAFAGVSLVVWRVGVRHYASTGS